jgi:hypothetical protein
LKRAFYSSSISEFLKASSDSLVDTLAGQAAEAGFQSRDSQLSAWRLEIEILKESLRPHHGAIYLEFSIPRMGRRIDALVLIGSVIFVLEFKVGESTFTTPAIDQVWDYALDLKNFHETSHHCPIVPILIPTDATEGTTALNNAWGDGVYQPIKATSPALSTVIEKVLKEVTGPTIDRDVWEKGRYRPTPTIIEAAMALYSTHSVVDISKSEADAENLARTSQALTEIIKQSMQESRKTICFVTGVPGAGKTLVGLKVATEFMSRKDELYSVYLSGNGPLVKILCEALARDKVAREKSKGRKHRIGKARSEAKAFIQNIHHFRDECLLDEKNPPTEHVTLFDEAQRAWNLKQTSDFMSRKKKRPNFDRSEPEFLISCVDRHTDWAVINCLVGGGQEINVGEAGIAEWISVLNKKFPQWQVHISEKLRDSEFGSAKLLQQLDPGRVVDRPELHLATSMRSFRAENVSNLIKDLLDLEAEGAKAALQKAGPAYPILLTRSLDRAKGWLRSRARGSERYGILVSSRAERLRPHAISVRTPVDPVHWFLDGKEDVRSSFYLEDVATEFDVQGLELDWTCVTWDADLRYTPKGWQHWSFLGDRWNKIHVPERQMYLKNAYRVLLTRARQGMVIVVPEGDPNDPTRDALFYDPTFEYLSRIGFKTL